MIIFFLDGYRKVKCYKDKGRLKNIDLILPVIELRLAKFCGHKEFKRINYHLIFSDGISADVIEQQFLNALTSKYKLDTDSKQTTWDGVITKENLANLGKKIKEKVPVEKLSDYGSDIEEGFNNLNIELSCIEAALQNASQYFDGKYVTAIGKTEWDSLNWNDSSIGEKKSIINGADIVFTASESIKAFYKGKKKLEEQEVNSFLIDCSDSHNNSWSIDKDRLGNCFTWIKADPTFEGLKQILNEKDRVFIGERPRLFDSISNNRTKYIETLAIKHVDDYKCSDEWFNNVVIDFNPELVAIIGNKGSGKSAIADIVALCCNAKNYDDFSFLNERKFKNKGLAKNFEATVKFKDDNEYTRNLFEESTNDKQPLVKYFPQGYFEDLCNNFEKDEDFNAEIENIVFQYVKDVDKLGASSFRELIKKKTDAIEK